MPLLFKKNIYIMGFFGAALGANLIGAGINNLFGYLRENDARQQNYEMAEMQARNADKRTRALYHDLYSPAAQIKQIKEAGLSPALMYGGGAGGASGQSGALANPSGINPNVFGVSPESAAQIALMKAQKENIEADTANKTTDNAIKQIEFQKLDIANKAFTDYVNKDGNKLSLYEFAKDCTSYENFVNQLRKMGMEYITDNEYGQQTLRDIYKARKQYATEIAVLSEEETTAKFQNAIVNALNAAEFPKYNAEQAVQALKAEISTEQLTESQKEAWNKLLEKLEKTNPTLKEIAIILSCIVTQFGGKVNANISKSTHTQNRNINVNK